MGNLATSADKPAGQTPAAAGPITASAASGAAAERRASGSGGATLEEFMGAQQYIDEIRRLEAEQKRKQERVVEMHQAIRQAQQLHSALSQKLTEENNLKRADRRAQLQARNEREVRVCACVCACVPLPLRQQPTNLPSHLVSLHKLQLRQVLESKRRELDGLILEVDDILAERRKMSREDVRAEVLRELREAWAQSSALLQARLERQREVELGVSRATHAKMMRDFLLRLQQEEQAQRAVLEAEQAQRKSGKKRGSGGIFSWLSPNKKTREEEEEDEEEDGGGEE